MNQKRAAMMVAVFALATWPLSQEYDWAKAEREIKRLPPTSFSQLPAAIISELEARGCTIPQSFVEPKPHNVVQGQFARAGQKDWVVLCSKEGRSSVLVFWGKPAACPRELAAKEDANLLQDIGGGRLAYSRYLGPVGRKFILDRYRSYGGLKPPPIHHRGINDAFAQKASVVHYCHEGKWLELTGSD